MFQYLDGTRWVGVPPSIHSGYDNLMVVYHSELVSVSVCVHNCGGTLIAVLANTPHKIKNCFKLCANKCEGRGGTI